MTLDVRLRREAQAEMEAAARWYERERDGLGDDVFYRILPTHIDVLAIAHEKRP